MYCPYICVYILNSRLMARVLLNEPAGSAGEC